MTAPHPCRIVACDADVAEGAAWLAVADPHLAPALAAVGPLPLRRRADGFGALLGAIVSQQVSVASAAAILARCESGGLGEPDVARGLDDDAMRAFGLSRQKARYVRALAEARLDYATLRTAPTDAVVATLTQVPGIGRWTAEIYAMFSLGHADVFAPGDLALQEGARMALGLDARPSLREMDAIAARWSPWRSVAARLLWAYYAHVKSREGIR